jgi:photosystem II stability/assembly factor-like uncharacterized protein
MMLFSVTTHAVIKSVPVANLRDGPFVAVSPGGSLYYTTCSGQIFWFTD